MNGGCLADASAFRVHLQRRCRPGTRPVLAGYRHDRLPFGMGDNWQCRGDRGRTCQGIFRIVDCASHRSVQPGWAGRKDRRNQVPDIEVGPFVPNTGDNDHERNRLHVRRNAVGYLQRAHGLCRRQRRAAYSFGKISDRLPDGYLQCREATGRGRFSSSRCFRASGPPGGAASRNPVRVRTG